MVDIRGLSKDGNELELWDLPMATTALQRSDLLAMSMLAKQSRHADMTS